MWPFSSGAAATEIVTRKRAQRDEALKSARTYSASEYDAILQATATEIVEHISRREWTASQVLEAYIARAAYAQTVTNCITEVLFEQARHDARTLDEEFSQTKRLRGPLHGVPLSIKDQYDYAGVDSTVGFTQWTDRPAKADAGVVRRMRDAGAIPFVKTNVPQTMLSFECSNPLWGRTKNPNNTAFTSGGSSGGEGALIAMDGSPLGLGSDIGGSLRIPSSFCGLYTLKPGFARTSHTGVRSPTPGFEGLRNSLGPMGRSVEDVELGCRVMFGTDPTHEWATAPTPYREGVQLGSKLRFGYYTNDGFVKASPACKRATMETVAALRNAGHECVEIDPKAYEAFYLFVALTSGDGYQTLLSHLGPDPQESSLFLPTLGPRVPNWLRLFAAWIVENVVGDHIFATMVRLACVKTMREFMVWTAKRYELNRTFYEEIWVRHNLDAIIAPVQALPCTAHGGTARLSPLAAATAMYNVLDLPVGVVPVTRVDAVQDALTSEWTEGKYTGSVLLEGALYRGRAPVYDPVALRGIPVGVQIVGRKWEEEKVVELMKIVDKALGKRGFGPGSLTV